VAGRILVPTRVGVWILFVLALANAVYLYFAPSAARTRYAWSIKPPVDAAFIGAGFLAGTLATALVLFAATRWRSFSTLPPALWVLATTLLAATLIHNDRFKWSFAPTWVWLVVYAGVPFVVPVLVLLQRRVAEREPRAAPQLRAVRALSAVCGVLLLAGAVALFVAPSSDVASTHSAGGSSANARQRVARSASAVARVPARNPAPMNAALTGGLIDHA
jgi:hypothetical protein